MVTRWVELTTSTALPVSVAEAKKALRVIDSASIATKANRSHGSGNSLLLITAKNAGSVGNQYSTRIIVSGNNTALSVTFVNNILTIYSATNGGGTATSTVNDIIAAIYENAQAGAIFDASGGAGTGTGVIVAATVLSLTAGVDSGDEDAYITFLIYAAAEVLEAITGQAFIERVFTAFYDRWPKCRELILPVSPVSSVDEIRYYDISQNLQIFEDDINVDIVDPKLPARLILKFGSIFPPLAYDLPNAVQVDFVAGYGDDSTDIPNKIKQCLLFLIAHWYMCREPVVNGTAVLSNKVPFTFETVLNSFKIITV